MRFGVVLVLSLFALTNFGFCYQANMRGPRFTLEPSSQTVFSSSMGGRIDCAAEGFPIPRIEWLLASESSPVTTIADARIVLSNGSLYFPAFAAERFRPDVHTATYKCSASNIAGRIVSLDIHVRAVVIQRYEATVYKSKVIPGNTALFTCRVPSYVRDYIRVTSWLMDNVFNIFPTIDGDFKHLMLPTGELHVLNVGLGDARSSYRCRTLHRLTGVTQESVSSGQVIIEEAKGPTAPRIVSDPLNPMSKTMVVRHGEDLVIPCVAQGVPPPNYWWYRKEGSRLDSIEVVPGVERRSIVGGSLVIRAVLPQDAGLYVCSVNNSAGATTLEVDIRVAIQPTAHIVPPTLRVDFGTPATFTCVTSVDQVTWLKDGQHLEVTDGVNGQKLQITSVQREDQGMYQCVVSTDGGAVHATAELRLGASKPQLVYQFIEHTMQPGPDVSLKCIATGQPTPQIHWTLDGFPLPENDRFVIGQYVTVAGDVISHVNISKAAVEDGGVYKCSAVNRMGKTSHSAPLRIYGLPVVRKMPPISAVAGEPLIVMCPASGYPIHTITWEKDGRVLPVNHRQSVYANGTLVVQNVQQRLDQGTYTCEARNRQGHSDRGSVKIAVMGPPTIYPFSIEDNVQIGNRVGLQCLITKGDTPLTIRWLKDDKPVSDLHLPSLTVASVGEFSSNLLIERVTREHEGSYTCEARNAAATATHTVQFAVNVPPDITPFVFPAVEEGSRVQVACNIHRGDLPLNITWLKDRVPVTTAQAEQVDVIRFNSYSSIVTMSSVVRADAGNYTCVASNPVRTVAHTAQLSVSVPPEWVTEPRDTSATAGQHVVIQCKADGFPEPKVAWRRSFGKEVGQFGDYISTNGTLSISSVTETDEGYYLCEANNGVGAGLSAVVFLTVNARPRFVSPVRKESVRRGGTATLQCQAQGDLPMTVNWRRDTSPFPVYNARYQVQETSAKGLVGSQLIIRQATSTDSGKYMCIASNPYGRVEMAIHFSVTDVPEPPSDVRITECGGRSLKVTWSEPWDNNSPILYYCVLYTTDKDKWPDVGESGEVRAWSVLTELLPSHTYYIRVVAVNQLGPSTPSSVVSATTDPESPSGPPQDVSATALGPHSIRVTWTPPQPEFRNGPILGYYIGIKKASEIQEGGFNYSTVKPAASDIQPTSYTVTGLHSFTQYVITVQAFNSVGAGPTSSNISIATQQTVPDGAPQHIECSALASDALQLNWMTPPSGTHNGIIQGYKLFYTKIHPPNDLLHEAKEMTTQTKDESHVLSGLEKFSNYSVQIAAFTPAGVGTKSEPIFCCTAQDVAGVPLGIRCALSNPHAAVITWAPPNKPNGVVTRYSVYQREIRNGKLLDVSKKSLPATTLQLNIPHLRQMSRYEWWVTAATGVGEGAKTRVVSLTPSSIVPAAVVTIPQTYVVPWKSSLSLHCQTVGIPRPTVTWTINRRPLSYSHAHKLPNGTLFLERLGKDNSGNYTCTAQNSHSIGSSAHNVLVLEPPTAPALEVVAITWNNVTLRWTKATSITILLGYILSYRQHISDEWRQVRLGADTTMYSIKNLPCGTRIQITLAAVNRVGEGDPGPTLDVSTLGGDPVPPPPNQAVTSSLHSITVHLEKWRDGGCPISHFSVEKKLYDYEEWTLVSESMPVIASYSMSGLEPATFYHLRVRAHSNSGSVTSYFYVSTLTLDGTENNVPEETTAFYKDMRIMLPIALCVFTLLFTVVMVFVCAHSMIWNTDPVETVPESKTEIPKPVYYANLEEQPQDIPEPPRPPPRREPSRDLQFGHEDDIYPYATFPVIRALQRGQPTSTHNAFQPYAYSGRGPSVGTSPKGSYYGQERGMSAYDLDDYDSLGSDSDSFFPQSYMNTTTNIRHSRLLSAVESSTSNEASPRRNTEQKIHHQRKGRFK